MNCSVASGVKKTHSLFDSRSKGYALRREWIVKERHATGHTWHALVVYGDGLHILCGAAWDNQWMGLESSWWIVDCPLCIGKMAAYYASETQEIETAIIATE